jgi:hypothetical protein
MEFSLWFDNRSKEFKIGVSFLFIFISSVIGWLIGQMLSLIALSCTIVLILVIFLIIKLKSE